MFDDMRMRENSGRLIKVYRELRNSKEKDRRFSCNEFVLVTQDHPFFEIASGSPVCSRATLNRLERGYAIKDDDLYYFFIEKLGFKAKEFPGLLDQAEKIGEYLYRAVEIFDTREIERLDKIIDLIFQRAKHYFYYYELYLALKTITNYYLNAEYPEDSISETLLDIYAILTEPISELIMNILFELYYYCKFEINKSHEIYECLVTYSGNLSCLFIAGWLLYKERILDALEIVNKGISYYNLLGSNYHLGTLYYTKALALHSSNKVDVLKYFNLSIEALNKVDGKLSIQKRLKNYFNIGFQYYYERNYVLAMDYFKEFLLYNPPFSVHLLYILNCAEELNVKDTKTIFEKIKMDSPSKSNACEVFYGYFKLKINSYPEKELEEYIMTDVYKILNTEYRSESILNYFKNELSKLVKITKRYKDLDSFNNFTSHKIE